MDVAIIGVVGTIAGTLLGWILNSQSYRLGKTEIFAELEISRELPCISDVQQSKPAKPPQKEYFCRCIASNSRQIPIVLNDIYVEMILDNNSKPIKLSVLESEIQYTGDKIKIGIRPRLARQIIPPRNIHDFSFKIECTDPNIEYSCLKLVAYDEKRKKHKFMIYDGRKLERPPDYKSPN